MLVIFMAKTNDFVSQYPVANAHINKLICIANILCMTLMWPSHCEGIEGV